MNLNNEDKLSYQNTLKMSLIISPVCPKITLTQLSITRLTAFNGMQHKHECHTLTQIQILRCSNDKFHVFELLLVSHLQLHTEISYTINEAQKATNNSETYKNAQINKASNIQLDHPHQKTKISNL